MSDQSRRKLLKSLAAGSGAIVAGKSLPDSWTKPVVDSVLLPAHAQTSNLRSFAGSGAVILVSNSDNDTLLSNLAGGLVNDAHAGRPPIKSWGYICGTEMIDVVDVRFQNNSNTVLRRGELPKNGDQGSLDEIELSDNWECGDPGSLDAWIVAVTDSYLDIKVQHDEGQRVYRVNASTACNLPVLDGVGGCDRG